MPLLETTRLFIRPFQIEDLEATYRLFDIELNTDDLRTEKMETKHERAEWLNGLCIITRNLRNWINHPMATARLFSNLPKP